MGLSIRVNGVQGMRNKPLFELKNIGKTVAAKLHEIGIDNEAELKKTGAAKAYRNLSRKHPERHLPLCYYLYSLEGAIRNRHWHDLSEQEKEKLRLAAGLKK